MRSHPIPILPVIHNGVKYAAPNRNGREGKIEARNATTDEKLWDTVVYSVQKHWIWKLIPHNEIEEDCQWVFINGMVIEGNTLLVANENNDCFALDLTTKRVTKLNKETAHVLLTQLKESRLDSSQVADAELAQTPGLTQRQALRLQGTRVSDAGLAQLAGLTQLQELNLKSTQVTDAGLAHLAGLTQLQELNLKSTKITDTGLAHLAELAQLQELRLDSTRVTDAGLAHLTGLTRLQT